MTPAVSPASSNVPTMSSTPHVATSMNKNPIGTPKRSCASCAISKNAPSPPTSAVIPPRFQRSGLPFGRSRSFSSTPFGFSDSASVSVAEAVSVSDSVSVSASAFGSAFSSGFDVGSASGSDSLAGSFSSLFSVVDSAMGDGVV